MTTGTIIVRPDLPTSDDGLRLLDAASEELFCRYGDLKVVHLEPGGLMPDQAAQCGSAFVIAWKGMEAIGCGALRPLASDVGEIKRVYVAPAARRQRVAISIMQTLEQTAREWGYLTLRLETGDRQPEAICLYESLGYRRIPCYPPYDDDPRSVCFEKEIFDP